MKSKLADIILEYYKVKILLLRASGSHLSVEEIEENQERFSREAFVYIQQEQKTRRLDGLRADDSEEVIREILDEFVQIWDFPE